MKNIITSIAIITVYLTPLTVQANSHIETGNKYATAQACAAVLKQTNHVETGFMYRFMGQINDIKGQISKMNSEEQQAVNAATIQHLSSFNANTLVDDCITAGIKEGWTPKAEQKAWTPPKPKVKKVSMQDIGSVIGVMAQRDCSYEYQMYHNHRDFNIAQRLGQCASRSNLNRGINVTYKVY